jgi:hypothetical protein
MINKRVRISLVGVDSNSFAVMGAWKEAARKQGWTNEEIKEVLDEATRGDYNHLMMTIVKYADPYDNEEGEWDEEEDDDEGWEEFNETEKDDKPEDFIQKPKQSLYLSTWNDERDGYTERSSS